MAKNCCVCGKPIGKDNWEKVRHMFPRMLKQVDEHGEDSLTEYQQVIYNEGCHAGCADQLN